MTRKRLSIAIPALVVLAIVVGSFLPMTAKVWLGTTRGRATISFPGTTLHFNQHRAVHLLAFGIAGYLVISLAARWWKRILLALATMTLALFVEAGESGLFHNRMEWADVGDDAKGILLALAITLLPAGGSKKNANRAASGK